MANLFIAAIAFTILKIILMNRADQTVSEPVMLLLDNLLIMNVSLAVFNLLPFPPLDGSKVLETFLPASMQPVLDVLEQYGYIIMMVLIYVGLIRAIIRPVMYFVYYLLYLGV